MDAESGRVLYEKNKDDRFLTASIAKIMTCIVAIENGNLFEKCKVDYQTVSMEGSSIYLELDDEIILYDLLCGLMLRSGNDAATLISKSVFKSTEKFVFEMNALAREIGMGNSTFENPTGLNTTTFNYSTAYDMALLMRYAMDNEIFVEISSKKNHIAQTLNKKYYWQNKHKLVANTDYVISGKTGYTKSSGRTLVSYALINNMKLIAVSFNEGGDFELHKMLFENAKKDFTIEKIIKKGVYPQEIDTLNYYPSTRNDIELLIKNDSNIVVKFYLLDKPNFECGYLEIFEDNKLIYRDTLYPYYPLS
jgi:D-alanyl-D-alanine carboxypeptidase